MKSSSPIGDAKSDKNTNRVRIIQPRLPEKVRGLEMLGGGGTPDFL